MLRTSSLDVVDTHCWVLQTLNFNVADVEFRCCRHVMLSLCRGGGRARDAGCTQHGSNMREGGREGGGLPTFECCTQPSRNGLQHLLPGSDVECCTQPSRNIARNGSQHLLPDFESDG
jgi:hypothetical protein